MKITSHESLVDGAFYWLKFRSDMEETIGQWDGLRSRFWVVACEAPVSIVELTDIYSVCLMKH